MGFLWPIVPQKVIKEADNLAPKPSDTSVLKVQGKPGDAAFMRLLGKKQESHTLLLNAMRTTAAQTHHLSTFETRISDSSLSELPRDMRKASETPGSPLNQDDEQIKLTSRKRRKRKTLHLITPP